MKLSLGTISGTREPLILDFEETINGNGLIFGQSGSGKTHLIRALSKYFSSFPGNRVIIFDVHGDIYPKAEFVSTVKISEASNSGLQPFVLSRDPEFGGVNRSISRFIQAINSTSTKLGPRQTPALTRLIEELFWRNGFHANDPRTWGLDYDPWPNRKAPKHYPTFDDLLRFIRHKQKEAFLGMNTDATIALESFLKVSSSVQKKRMKSEDFSDSEMEESRKQALKAYEDFLKSENDSKVIDNKIKYNSKETLSSIIDRLETLEKKGLFKNQRIVFDPSKSVHRYDLSTLEKDEQKIFIQLALSDLFLKARADGFGGKTKTLIFIDEAKNYIDDHESNMIRKLYNEIRKFGYGIWLAGQRIEHFDDDIIASAGTKLIMGVDGMFAKRFSQRLHIPIEKIHGIKLQKTMLAEISKKTEGEGFIEVTL